MTVDAWKTTSTVGGQSPPWLASSCFLFTCRPSRLFHSWGPLPWRTPHRRSPIKFCPSFSCETTICAQRCEKTTAAANRYLFSSQSGGELFRTVTLNKLSDSFEWGRYLKTSLLPHLQHTHSEFVQLPWTVSLSCHLSKVDKAFKLPDYYPSVRKITASLSVSNVYWREEIPANKTRFAARCN